MAFRKLPIRAGGGGSSTTRRYPFDIIITASSENETATATIHPGTISQLLPTNMYDTFNITDNNLYYLIGNVVSNGEYITSCSLTIGSSITPQVPTPFSLPTSFQVCLGLIKNRIAYRTIGLGSISLAGTLAFSTELESAAAPGELTYIPYYMWAVYLQ